MQIFAHSRSLLDKFSGDGKPLYRVDLAEPCRSGGTLLIRRARRPEAAPAPTAAAIDAVQRKQISLRNKPTRKGRPSSRRVQPRFFNRQKRLARRKFWLPARPYLDKQILPSYGIVLSPSAV
jgi:hypothetical protein